MFPYIDTHCHLDQILEKTGAVDFADLRARFFTPEFESCLTIACDPDAIAPTLGLLDNEGVFGSFGIHPHDAARYTSDVKAAIAAALVHPKCVAYGEIGLDYHYDISPRDVQRAAFRIQIEVAVEAKKPIVIHTREAEEDTLHMMRDHVPRDWPVHVHCFTSSRALAESLLADFTNLYVGFTGILTFKNADDVRDTARIVPLDRLLVETDGPYLAPAPYRGKPAHPGHIPLIIEKLAEVREQPVATIATATLENAKRLYSI
jgi:TatD DNase family protein